MRVRWPQLLAVVLLAIVEISAVPAALAQSYGSDLTGTSGAIDCGNNGINTPDRAFDNSAATTWQSSQSGAAVDGAACVGQDFGSGTTYHIQQFGLTQSATAANEITSVIVQSSSNGSAWNNIATVTVIADGNLHYYAVTASTAYRYWRLLANANTSSGRWVVVEAEMAELLSLPSATPTITVTPSTTPTPTYTPTPDYFVLGTLSTVNYPIAIKPTGDFGDLGIMVVGLVIAGLGFIAFIVWLLIGVRRTG